MTGNQSYWIRRYLMPAARFPGLWSGKGTTNAWEYDGLCYFEKFYFNLHVEDGASDSAILAEVCLVLADFATYLEQRAATIRAYIKSKDRP